MNNTPKSSARHEETIRRLVLLALLYLIPTVQAMRPIVVADPDIWWHLSAGQWIVAHGTVPVTDPFSSYGMDKPWVAYSWLFELVIYGFYQAFGLVGLVLYTVTLSLLIALALHVLIRRLTPNFPLEIAITALGLSAILPLATPRPWLFTVLFFIIELNLLLSARRTGNLRPLLFLPLLFLLWANIHIQFAYGLFVLGLVAAESMIEWLWQHRSATAEVPPSLPLGPVLAIIAVCVLATLVTPYHFFLYQTLIDTIKQIGPFHYVSELAALQFRALPDWCVLTVTVGAAFSLGWQRNMRPFPVLLFIAGALLSFRARRDAWFVTVAAVSIVASSWPNVTLDRFVLTTRRKLVATAAVITMLGIAGWWYAITQSHLESEVAKHYPAAAATVVEEQGYLGPLYNHFNWGGYLIWRLPHLPVAIDGRTNVHGDERIERSLQTWAGATGWASDPDLIAARLVIAHANRGLTSLLRRDPHFELVYEDDVAAVFVARYTTSRPRVLDR